MLYTRTSKPTKRQNLQRSKKHTPLCRIAEQKVAEINKVPATEFIVRYSPEKWMPLSGLCSRRLWQKKERFVIYPDGRFGCAAHQRDSNHRRQIWQLTNGGGRGDQTPPRMRLPIREQPDRRKRMNEERPRHRFPIQ